MRQPRQCRARGPVDDYLGRPYSRLWNRSCPARRPFTVKTRGRRSGQGPQRGGVASPASTPPGELLKESASISLAAADLRVSPTATDWGAGVAVLGVEPGEYPQAEMDSDGGGLGGRRKSDYGVRLFRSEGVPRGSRPRWPHPVRAAVQADEQRRSYRPADRPRPGRGPGTRRDLGLPEFAAPVAPRRGRGARPEPDDRARYRRRHGAVERRLRTARPLAGVSARHDRSTTAPGGPGDGRGDCPSLGRRHRGGVPDGRRAALRLHGRDRVRRRARRRIRTRAGGLNRVPDRRVWRVGWRRGHVVPDDAGLFLELGGDPPWYGNSRGRLAEYSRERDQEAQERRVGRDRREAAAAEHAVLGVVAGPVDDLPAVSHRPPIAARSRSINRDASATLGSRMAGMFPFSNACRLAAIAPDSSVATTA